MFEYIKSLFHKIVIDWDFETSSRDPNQTMQVLNSAYNVDGLKELLANDIYFYKRKFVESKGEDASSLYHAEAYKRLLSKMVKSHEFSLKQIREVPPLSAVPEMFEQVDSSLE